MKKAAAGLVKGKRRVSDNGKSQGPSKLKGKALAKKTARQARSSG